MIESVPNHMNFPTTHPCYLGVQWNERRQNEALARADVVLVIDSDVPWISAVNRPRADARIFHIDADPLKTADAAVVHRRDAAMPGGRRTGIATDPRRPRCIRSRSGANCRGAGNSSRLTHASWQRVRVNAEQPREELTAEYLVACIRDAMGEDAIVVSESVTNFHVVSQHMRRTRPGTLFSSGGGSLGYNGGAAFGMKLAKPDALVVAICGDGSYLFSQPSTVHWLARAYQAPFLHVVLNNGGWRAPRQAVLSVYPDGIAARAPNIDIHFPDPPDYAGIAAAAGGAHPEVVRSVAQVKPALERALQAVLRERRAAVIDAHMSPDRVRVG